MGRIMIIPYMKWKIIHSCSKPPTRWLMNFSGPEKWHPVTSLHATIKAVRLWHGEFTEDMAIFDGGNRWNMMKLFNYLNFSSTWCSLMVVFMGIEWPTMWYVFVWKILEDTVSLHYSENHYPIITPWEWLEDGVSQISPFLNKALAEILAYLPNIWTTQHVMLR